MKNMEISSPCRIWLDTIEKIASFHSVVNFELHEFANSITFDRYTSALISAGYRFQ